MDTIKKFLKCTCILKLLSDVKHIMKSEEMYQNLVELAEKFDITVSEQNLKISGINVRSGLCKVKGKKMFIMSKHNKLYRKIELLATCLSAVSTEEIYVVPAVRTVLEKYARRGNK